MQYLFASVGSLGDTLPYLELANEMHLRGHSVSFFCNEEHRARIEKTSVAFVSAGSGLQYLQTMQNPNLWHSVKGMGVLWRGMMLPSIEPLYAAIKRMQDASEEFRVVAAPHMLGARLAQEHLNANLISVYTASSMLRTFIAPTTIAHTRWPRGTPRWLLRLIWSGLDRYKLEPMARRHINQVCLRLGIIPPDAQLSLFGQWIHSTQRGITLYPSWFCPVPKDIAAPIVSGEFPISISSTNASDAPLDARLDAFLSHGAAPVVVSLGSGMLHASELYSRWQSAILESGLRGILISPDANQLPKEVDANVMHLSFAPFAQLLPRCHALIHHGGIGSCIQALAAGIPQVIQPHAHDQFENARCAQALGVAMSIQREASVNNMSQLLDQLKQTQLLQKAQQIKQLMPSQGSQHVCDLIEAQ